MKSELTRKFRACFRRLPPRVQRDARKAYRIWRENPNHPGIDFKRVGLDEPVYSVRIGRGWRALGLLEDDMVLWFWIGPHAEYDRLWKQM